MRISTSKKPPSTRELAEILKREFSGRYSYKLSGLGSDKVIVVRKSTFVGAQISQTGNDITIEGTFHPSSAASFLYFFDCLITEGALMAVSLGSKCKKFEKEIAVFLHRKYN